MEAQKQKEAEEVATHAAAMKAAGKVDKAKEAAAAEEEVGRCRLTASKPELNARLVSELGTENVMNRFQTMLSISTCGATTRRPSPTPSTRRRRTSGAARQGLTLVHVRAQFESLQDTFLS